MLGNDSALSKKNVAKRNKMRPSHAFSNSTHHPRGTRLSSSHTTENDAQNLNRSSQSAHPMIAMRNLDGLSDLSYEGIVSTSKLNFHSRVSKPSSQALELSPKSIFKMKSVE